MELHLIMYVEDQHAEREFYEKFGFEVTYEGPEFPGFLALSNGAAGFGLQRASREHPAYFEGLRWQFELGTTEELDRIVDVCRTDGLPYEETVEVGGDRFRTRLVTVTSPAGVVLWFEGPNEIST